MSQPMDRHGLSRRLRLSLCATLLTYLVAELVLSVYGYLSWAGTSLFLFEDAGRTWQFDPIRGYRLTSTPSRFMRITNGTLEYVGVARGNAQGFPDRDDFHPEVDSGSVPRIAVFGDSFTASQFVGQNWPDRAEDLARERGTPLELLNFAVDGGGLANWWSILTRFVDAQGYPLDGVVFAVFGDDLQRKFTVLDQRGRDHSCLTRMPTWDPRDYPTTLEEARPLLADRPDTYNLSSEEFERTLQGHWPSAAGSRLRPLVASTALSMLRKAYHRLEASHGAPSPPDPHRQRLIDDIAASLGRRRIPILVVYIPNLRDLGDPESEDARSFALALRATYVGGAQVYAGLTSSEIRALHLPYDGHWNQAGTNRFAELVLPHLMKLRRSPEGQP